ncbi:hypothetical protein [Sphingobium sp. WCS2017Hpa-17]|uniref:Lar family restriction alleviation protein n=1 Tax=Sphingobium sp. WCS2017Hpa-17 TaxID=3073638 RepID=UPI00288B6D9A|nr:hypothetical protein [Sphingobium sp. WCS2017Hpa-17]
MTTDTPSHDLRSALEPCPFCGGEPVMRKDDDPGYPWYVTFEHDPACVMYAVPTDMFRSFSTEAEAIAAWKPMGKGSLASPLAADRCPCAVCKEARTARRALASDTIGNGGGEAAKATREWAENLANMRQGQSSTPRCEPPSEREIQWARNSIKDVLAASPPLYAHPPAAEPVGLREAVIAAMTDDPYWNDRAGTTDHDARLQHYADVIVAKLQEKEA